MKESPGYESLTIPGYQSKSPHQARSPESGIPGGDLWFCSLLESLCRITTLRHTLTFYCAPFSVFVRSPLASLLCFHCVRIPEIKSLSPSGPWLWLLLQAQHSGCLSKCSLSKCRAEWIVEFSTGKKPLCPDSWVSFLLANNEN